MNSNKGFSLLELLITLVITSIGLFGLLKLVTLSAKMSQDTLWRAVAQNELLNAYTIIQSGQTAVLQQWHQDLDKLLPQAELKQPNQGLSLTWYQPQQRQLSLPYAK